jgi:hypothetical protein
VSHRSGTCARARVSFYVQDATGKSEPSLGSHVSFDYHFALGKLGSKPIHERQVTLQAYAPRRRTLEIE